MSQPSEKRNITVWRLPEEPGPIVCVECQRKEPREDVGTNFRALPPGWYFAVATHDDNGQPSIISACSKKCALAWERKLPDEENPN